MPSPNHTPAQTGRLLAQLRMPRAVNASTMKSQLIRPAVITAGATATIMASHGRCSCRWAHSNSRKNPNSNTAFTPTKIAAAWEATE